MKSHSSTSPDIRLDTITSIQEVVISKKNKPKNRKSAEKGKPTREEDDLPSTIIRHETSILEQPVKKRKKERMKNNSEEHLVFYNNQSSHIDDLGISRKKTKKRRKLDKEDDEKSTKVTRGQTESVNGMEKRKKKKRFQENTHYDSLTIDRNVAKISPRNDEISEIVVSRKHKKNKENRNDKMKYEPSSSKDSNLDLISFENRELGNSKTNRKHISKKKYLNKSKKVSDDLSQISRSSDETSKKRKRSHEHSRMLSSIEDILHKSKKAKLKPDKKYTYLDYTGKIQQETNDKIHEEATEKERLANEPFENRLRTGCAKVAAKKKKNVEIKPDKDISDNILYKLIKSRKKMYDKQIQESVCKNQQVNKEVQETIIEIFPTKDENILETPDNENNCADIENSCANIEKCCANIENNCADKENNCADNENCADTQDKSMHLKNKRNKTCRKEQINRASIKTAPSCVLENNTNTYKCSKSKKMHSNEEKNLNMAKEVTNDIAIDQLSVKTADDTKEYINGIKLSTLQLSSLKGLIVTLPFMPHPVHMIETKLTNRPKPGQRKEMEALGYQLITKLYSSSEDTTILNNWKEFCERHTLDEDAGPFLVPNKYFLYQERVKFAQYLARGLEHRTLASVYKRFRLLSSTHLKKGKFSKEEDRIIIEHIALAEQHGLTKKRARVFAKLATILNRGRLQIEKHYITMCKEKCHKLSIKSYDTLIKNLLLVLGKEDFTELEKCKITLSHWKTLEALLNHPYNYLRSYWRNTVYPKLFNEGYKNMYGILKDMTRILQKKQIQDWKVISWDKIAQRFKGQTSVSLYKSYKGLVYSKVPRADRTDLRACIEYLTSNYFNKESKWFCYKTALKRISQDDNGDFVISKKRSMNVLLAVSQDDN